MPGGRIEIDVEPNLKGFDGKVASGLRGLQGPLGSTAKGIGLAVAGGIGLAAVGFKQVIDIGIEYQNSLNTLQAVSHATGDQMARVGATAKALGSDMSLPATSAADAAAAMTELAKGGLSVDQAMTAAKGTLQLAAAAQIDAAQAAEIQSQALNAFGLSADNAGHVSDVLANAANAASGEITDFAQAMGQVGAVAHQFGLSIDETTTALGLFANAGIKGSDAGTLIKSALLALANPSKPAAKAIEQLGLKTYDATGKFVGLKSIFEQLHAASGRMTDAQYQQATATVFGSDAVRLAGVAAGTTGEQWDAMATAIGHAGGASEVAAAKTKGLGGAIEGFKSQVETVQIDVFEKIGPALEAGVRGAANAVSKYGPVVVDGLQRAIDFGAEVGPGIAKKVEAGAREVGQAAQKLILPFEQAAKQSIDGGIGIVTTAFGGFVDVARKGVEVAQPLARGIADIASGATTASGPIGAVREGLELGYDAASAVLTVVKPLAEGIGEVAHFFGELPGPIQTAAFALLALKVGPSILNGLKGSLSGVRGEADGASAKLGLVGKTVGVITAPARAAVGAVGGVVGVLRQFNDETKVQREIGAATGQSIGRLATAAAAFNTSALPAVASARAFRDQTVAIREGAAAAGQPISAMGAAMGTLVERVPILTQMRTAFQGASEGAGRFGTATGIAAAGATGLRVAAGGLLGALGGPWGIALAAAGIGLSLLAGRNQEAAQKTAEHKQAVEGLVAAMKEDGGVMGQATIAANNKALADKNVANNAKAAGLSFAEYAAAATGSTSALDTVRTSTDSVLTSIMQAAGATPEWTQELLNMNHQLLTSGGTAADFAGQLDSMTVATESQSQAQITLSDAQKSQIVQILNANGALGEQLAKSREARDQYLQLASVLEGVSKGTVELWDAQLKQASSATTAAGANLSYRESLDALGRAQKASADALRQYGKDSEQYRSAVFAEEHAILSAADAKRQDAIAGSKAASDLGKQREGLVAYNAEIARVAKSYKGELPQALTDVISKMDAASAIAAGLAVEINAAGEAVVRLPDGKEIKIAADITQAQKAIAEAKALGDATTATARVFANADPATGAVIDWQNTTRTVVGNTTTVTNTDPATGKVFEWKTVTDATGAKTTTLTTTDPATGQVLTWKRNTDGTWGFVNVGTNGVGAANSAIDNAARDRHATIFVGTVGTPGGGTMGVSLTGRRVPNAEGNLVQAYAAGGLHKLTPMRAGLAQVVPPNTWRIVGDRIRDDEAYIPINRDRRSVSLLRETAGRMGFALLRRYAEGGVAMRSPAPQQPVLQGAAPVINNNVTVRDNEDAHTMAQVISAQTAWNLRVPQ